MVKELGLGIISVIFSLSCVISAFTQQESMTITTYYPSPYGSYRELRSQRMAIGDTYYGSNYCWSPDSCANQIDANADLVVEGNVGIGTTQPRGNLHIHSSTSQGHLLITGVSDSGRTYSALYLGSDDIGPQAINNNSWVIAHKKDIGRAWENDFFLGRWKNNVLRNDITIDDATGNVGIGTADPDERLQVNGNILANNGYMMGTNNAGIKVKYGRTVSIGIRDHTCGTFTINYSGVFSNPPLVIATPISGSSNCGPCADFWITSVTSTRATIRVWNENCGEPDGSIINISLNWIAIGT